MSVVDVCSLGLVKHGGFQGFSIQEFASVVGCDGFEEGAEGLLPHASFDTMDGLDDRGLGFVLDFANDYFPGFPLHKSRQRPLSGLQSSNVQINFPVAEFIPAFDLGRTIMDYVSWSRDPFAPAA